MPRSVVALGYAQQIEFHDGPTFTWPKSDAGPWLVTNEAGSRLWIVSRGRVPKAEDDWAGAIVRAVAYFPFRESGKHDPRRGYRHEFGEGGNRDQSEWPEAYPVMRKVDGGRAWEFVGGEFAIRPEGIVG